MSFEDEVRALSKLVERLARRFPHVPRERIEAAVQEEHRTLDGRPVRAYVPLLVERCTTMRLKTLALDTPEPASPALDSPALDSPALDSPSLDSPALGAGEWGRDAGLDAPTTPRDNGQSGLPHVAGDPIEPMT
ncbi:three-helix bundle dimerization domain-containing protein [Cryobacterium sp. MLB-32]|uniref:three-helix bundle dimerization domain-containing protein n=1 Tax=Cryobacterium sp. MLB-32 TaxID=1529318 RepID=UPI0012E03C32|nr:hypothetical protein [Cryobacterium sp. MLB-32]